MSFSATESGIQQLIILANIKLENRFPKKSGNVTPFLIFDLERAICWWGSVRCIRICLGFRDLVGMTLRDFKYQPHVTGGSKCLEKHFATWYGNMFLCFEILFPQSLQTCFVWIVTRWSFNHRKHLLCSDTRTASRYIVNKQLCLCLWSLWGWLLPSWVRCQGLSLTFPLHWQSLPESERGFPWNENTSILFYPWFVFLMKCKK